MFLPHWCTENCCSLFISIGETWEAFEGKWDLNPLLFCQPPTLQWTCTSNFAGARPRRERSWGDCLWGGQDPSHAITTRCTFYCSFLTPCTAPFPAMLLLLLEEHTLLLMARGIIEHHRALELNVIFRHLNSISEHAPFASSHISEWTFTVMMNLGMPWQ